MTQVDREFDFTKPFSNKKLNRRNKSIMGLGLFLSTTLFIGSSFVGTDKKVENIKIPNQIASQSEDIILAQDIFTDKQLNEVKSLMSKFGLKEIHIAPSLEGNKQALYVSYIKSNSDKINMKEYAYQDAEILVDGDYKAPFVLVNDKNTLKIKNSEQFYTNPMIGSIKDFQLKNNYLHSQLTYLLHRINRSEIFETYAKTGKLPASTASEVPYIYQSYVDEAKLGNGYFWLSTPVINKINVSIFSEFKKNGWKMTKEQVCDLSEINSVSSKELKTVLFDGQTCDIPKVVFSPNIEKLNQK